MLRFIIRMNNVSFITCASSALYAKTKRNVIIYAKTHGNRAVARQHSVNEKNVRLWRTQSDALFRCTSQHKTFWRQKALYPDVEQEVTEYVEHRRAISMQVTRKLICRKALEFAQGRGIDAFKASECWWNNFMKRSGLSLRCRTSICQKLPANFEKKMISCQKYVIRMRLKYDYESGQRRNADETPVYFDIPCNTTIVEKGFKGSNW